jgi:streptomycin 6-kinase
MAVTVPSRLAAYCVRTTERVQWLERLPFLVEDLRQRWGLSLGAPYDGENVSCAWVAPATRADGTPTVLKLGMPHMEGEHEIQGLRFWKGEPTVKLLEADDSAGAMLLERCQPGTALRELPEPEQDIVLAGLLQRLWRLPPTPHSFRPLSDLIDYWSAETLAYARKWPDKGLVEEGLRLLEELAGNGSTDVLLATDLHAGNVLRAKRQEWLVIDPKPFVGDPAYDATQHLFNCEARMHVDPQTTIRRFAELLEIDYERVRLWMFARAAAQPRDEWREDEWTALARRLAP